MASASLFSKNRKLLNKDLYDINKRIFFSPAIYSNNQQITRAIEKHVRGKVIDLGCGDMPYKKLIEERSAGYESFDIEKRVEGVTYCGDILDMKMIDDDSYDTAICLEVLEHVKEPVKALMEINRILRPKGTVIISVPHLSRLHEEPNDYFRFTKHGLKHIMENTDFEVLEINASGGIFSFLGHQWSTFFVLAFWRIPILKQIVFFINKWFCLRLSLLLDKIVDKQKIFALGYVCIAKKK